MAITKAMLARCQNEKMQAFCALDKDVQEAIESNPLYSQWLANCGVGKFQWESGRDTHCANLAFRLSPDTPTEQEWEERDVGTNNNGMRAISVPMCGEKFLSLSVNCVRFLGIIYRASDGTESLRTSVDAAFGTPIRVRFAK